MLHTSQEIVSEMCHFNSTSLCLLAVFVVLRFVFCTAQSLISRFTLVLSQCAYHAYIERYALVFCCKIRVWRIVTSQLVMYLRSVAHKTHTDKSF